MGVAGIRHAGIVVSDMSRSLPFYRDLLGMEVWFDMEDASPFLETLTEVPGARLRAVKLRAQDGVSIELLQYLSHPQAVPAEGRACDVGCNHVALQVEDIGALYDRLTAAGIRFHAPPSGVPGGGARIAYCRDPEGVVVELVQLGD